MNPLVLASALIKFVFYKSTYHYVHEFNQSFSVCRTIFCFIILKVHLFIFLLPHGILSDMNSCWDVSTVPLCLPHEIVIYCNCIIHILWLLLTNSNAKWKCKIRKACK